MDPKILRRLVLVVFVGGIAGMIVGSIADNNGIAITFGLITAVAAICLMLVTSVAARDRLWCSTSDGQKRWVAHPDPGRRGPTRTASALVRDAVVLGRSARAVPVAIQADHRAVGPDVEPTS